MVVVDTGKDCRLIGGALGIDALIYAARFHHDDREIDFWDTKELSDGWPIASHRDDHRSPSLMREIALSSW